MKNTLHQWSILHQEPSKPKEYPNSNDMMRRFTMAEDPKAIAVGEKLFLQCVVLNQEFGGSLIDFGLQYR